MLTEWMEYWIKGACYFLATGIGPSKTKELSRFPIPKQGKPNEYRPASLLDDLYCIVISFSFKQLARTLEESGVFSEDVNTYRPGNSAEETPNAMAVKQQETAQTGEPFVMICEDGEKYFDRVTPEVQLTDIGSRWNA